MLDELFTVTHFFARGALHKSEKQYSLTSLAETIEAASGEAKDLLPWLKFAHFGNLTSGKNSLRHDANVQYITGCEGDYDGMQMSFDQARDALREHAIGCILHTSPSHSADKPRWRVLAPCSKNCPKEQRASLVARLNGVLGGVLGAESFTLSQSYLYGHLDGGAEHRVEALDGRYIDLCDELDQIAIGKPGTKKAGDGGGNGHDDWPQADREELIRMICSGESLHPAARSLIGSYAATGVPIDACLEIIKQIGSGQPRYGTRWPEIVKLANYVYGKQEAKQEPAVPDPTSAPAAPWVWDSIDWDGVEIPQREWTVPELIPAQNTCLFSGYGGGGKSTVGLHLAAAHAIGLSWLGVIPEQGGAFFVDAEDPIGEIHRRLAAVTRNFGCRFADLIKGGLQLKSLHGQNAVMATADRAGVIRPTPLYQQILEQAGDLKPVQTIIAPASHVYTGSEIDRSQVTQFVNLMTRIAVASGGSVILISHPSLTGMTNQSGISGSTAWHNAVRARMYLETLKNGDGADAQPEHELRVLRFLKNQYGPPAKEITLRYQNGMFLTETKPTDYETAAREAKADTAFMEMMASCKGRTSLSPNQFARNYAPSLFAKLPAASGIKKPDLVAAMERLLKKGTLQIKTWGPPSKQAQYLEIT